MTGERPWTDEQWLEDRYWRDHMTLQEMADEAGCSESTVRRWMDRLGIPRRPPGYNGVPKDELLADLERVARELNKAPSRAEYNEHGEHCARTAARYFVTWSRAKELAHNRVRFRFSE